MKEKQEKQENKVSCDPVVSPNGVGVAVTDQQQNGCMQYGLFKSTGNTTVSVDVVKQPSSNTAVNFSASVDSNKKYNVSTGFGVKW